MLALHVFSDAAIAVSYYVIPMALAYFVWRRKDLAFSGIFWMFALFIVACGTTHWFGILTVWYPDYWTEGGIKLVTAALSVATAVRMGADAPRALHADAGAIPRGDERFEFGGGASGNRGAGSGNQRAAV